MRPADDMTEHTDQHADQHACGQAQQAWPPEDDKLSQGTCSISGRRFSLMASAQPSTTTRAIVQAACRTCASGELMA